jgi:hypothetical protein
MIFIIDTKHHVHMKAGDTLRHLHSSSTFLLSHQTLVDASLRNLLAPQRELHSNNEISPHLYDTRPRLNMPYRILS